MNTKELDTPTVDPKTAFLEHLDKKIEGLRKVREAVARESVDGSWMQVTNSKRAYRVNPFNDFVSEQVRNGKTRKQAIRLWRKRTKSEQT